MPIMSLYDKETKSWVEVPTMKGSPASIKVGSITTVGPTEGASVNNSGTTSDAVLDFKIPRGVDGITPVRGTDYWTAADQQQIIKDVSDKLEYSFADLMNAIQNKPVTYILTNKEQLDSLLDLSNDTITYNEEVKKLNPGDIFLLTSIEEPDYWFGEDSNGEKLHELDARKIDLTQYVKKSNMQVLTLEQYEALESYDPECFYFIVEGS